MPTLSTSNRDAAIAALDRIIAAAMAERAALVGEVSAQLAPTPEPEPEPPVELMPLRLAAIKLGVAPDSLRRACRDGRIGASEKISERAWLVDYCAAVRWTKTLPAW